TWRATRYYQNLRFVYEVESKVRDLKEYMPEENKKQEQQPDDKKQQQNNKKQDRTSNPLGPNDRENAERFRRDTAAVEVVALRGTSLPFLTAAKLKQSIASRRVSRNELNRRTA